MNTAKLLRDNIPGFTGHAAVYELSPPMEWKNWLTKRKKTAKYVVVSATSAAAAIVGEPETYIFKSTKTGKVKEWGELDGSYRGGLSHEEALNGAGYEITN